MGLRLRLLTRLCRQGQPGHVMHLDGAECGTGSTCEVSEYRWLAFIQERTCPCAMCKSSPGICRDLGRLSQTVSGSRAQHGVPWIWRRWSDNWIREEVSQCQLQVKSTSSLQMGQRGKLPIFRRTSEHYFITSSTQMSAHRRVLVPQGCPVYPKNNWNGGSASVFKLKRR